MSKKLLFLMSFILLICFIFASTASADLVGHWKLDETSGNIANDSSGNGNDGILHGDINWVPGNIGGAWQADGAGDYIEVEHSESLNISDAVTVAFWVWPASLGDHGMITEKGGTGGSSWRGSYGIRIQKENSRINFRGHSYANTLNGNTIPNIFDGWFHVAVTFDIADSGNNQKIYINGLLDAENHSDTPLSTNTETLVIGMDKYGGGRYYLNGVLDDVRIYDHALTEEEILEAMAGVSITAASAPNPADVQDDVDRYEILSWTPVETATSRDVYLGTDFEDVNNADRTNPLDVLVSQAQVPNSYDPGRLELGQTYYWRIDEVNAAPDNTIFKGITWSFTAEPVAYPIQGVAVTASTASVGADANNTTNESGLTDDLHLNSSATMWLSESDPAGASIQYDFDKAYKLHELWVWNHNTAWESLLGYGAKNVTIETSTDANNWTALGDFEFARADGTNTYAHNTTIDFAGTVATHVRLNIKSNWGGLTTQFGLSEVRFNYTPVAARYPVPADGQTDLPLDVALDWRAGREAVQHKVYLDTDQQAVADGSDAVLIATADDSEYTVNALELGATYYWKIDEVNEAETIATRQGEVWNFSTQEYLVVDDFESYNDIPVGEQDSSLVYLTWVDGFENPTNGSTMGYFEAFQPTMEPSIVHDGKQSVPLYYDNTVAGYSEATAKIADLAIGQDWTKSGIKSLSLWFYGDPNNAAEQMYVKLNGAKVLYDGDAANLASAAWQPWNIELADFGVNLSSVTEISIGFERSGVTGGTGMVLLDALRLYSYDRQLITPTEPDTANLVAHYEFEGTANDSAGVNHGTVVGEPNFVAGKVGQALEFDGVDDYVDCGNGSSLNINDKITVAGWIKTTSTAHAYFVSKGTSPDEEGHYALGQEYNTPITIQFEIAGSGGAGELDSNVAVNDGQWHHIVGTYDDPTVRIYVDGVEIANTTAPDGLTGSIAGNLTIGQRGTNIASGTIDDVRIYDRALSEGEIGWLGGRIKPYDKPF